MTQGQQALPERATTLLPLPGVMSVPKHFRDDGTNCEVRVELLSSASAIFHCNCQAPQIGICLPGTIKGDTTESEQALAPANSCMTPAGPRWATFTIPLAQTSEPGLTQIGRGGKAHRTSPSMAKGREGTLAAHGGRQLCRGLPEERKLG